MRTSYKYAARLNSFKNGVSGEGSPAQRGVLGLLSRAASVPGLNAVDLNFPDHLEGVDLKEMRSQLDALGLSVNGFAMRYYSDTGFKIGPSPILMQGCDGLPLTKPSVALTRCSNWVAR